MKIKELLAESEDFSSECQRIKDLTAANDHTEARLAGAKLLGHDDLASEYSDIIKVHRKTGHLSNSLSNRRNKADEELFKHAKKKLGPADLAQFRSSF